MILLHDSEVQVGHGMNKSNPSFAAFDQTEVSDMEAKGEKLRQWEERNVCMYVCINVYMHADRYKGCLDLM